jgi:hypothetical protein
MRYEFYAVKHGETVPITGDRISSVDEGFWVDLIYADVYARFFFADSWPALEFYLIHSSEDGVVHRGFLAGGRLVYGSIVNCDGTVYSANSEIVVVPKWQLELRFNTVGSKYPCPICHKWFRPAMMAVWPMLAGTWSPVCEQCAAEQGFTLTLPGSSLAPAEELAHAKHRQPGDLLY